tara:strand:- start:1355 stop:2194 length:840 start_codon:yes stop_codon:yes gene_type:complete
VPEYFQFSSPIGPNKIGGYNIFVNRKGDKNRQNIFFQVSNVEIPWGVTTAVYKNNNPKGDQIQRKYIDISFNNLHNNKKLNDFYILIKDIDKMLLNSVTEGTLIGESKNTQDILRKVPLGVVKPSIRVDPNKKYPDTMKFNITDTTKLYINKESRIPTPLETNSIPKGSKADIVIELASIYIIGNISAIGITYRVHQIRLRSFVIKLQDYAFIDDSESDTESSEYFQNEGCHKIINSNKLSDNSENYSWDGELPIEERRLSYVEFQYIDENGYVDFVPQ